VKDRGERWTMQDDATLPLEGHDHKGNGWGTVGEAGTTRYSTLLDGSPPMRRVRAIVEEVADTDATVLIRGESGVGKDVVARAIHEASSRREYPLVKVNCAALPPDLLESELFGHEKGSFTGAYRRKLGKFEFANKGTILLDEIGELAPGLQAKLLHVLQDFQFSRIGAWEMIRADVRVIASTNRDLEQALQAGQFREDLYYRLNVIELRIPPLRERREEIPGLAAAFTRRYNEEYHRNVSLTSQEITLFMAYSWPGNVRELENMVRRGVVLGNPEHVCQELRARLRLDPPGERAIHPGEANSGSPPNGAFTLGLKEVGRRAAAEAERKVLLEVLERVRWNRSEAARVLKVSYKTLLNKITECGLNSERAPGKLGSRSPGAPIAAP
jgi:two-component system, NtrC family, response regulator AtoC